MGSHGICGGLKFFSSYPFFIHALPYMDKRAVWQFLNIKWSLSGHFFCLDSIIYKKSAFDVLQEGAVSDIMAKRGALWPHVMY